MTSASFGAPSTIAFVMPVNAVILGGISRSGSTSVLNVSMTLLSETFTAPISVIASVPDRAMVSKSTTTYVLDHTDSVKVDSLGSSSSGRS